MVGQDPYSLIGIGNAFLSDYTVDLSVGSLPTASVSFEGSNINSQNGVISGAGPDQPATGELPSVNPEDGTIIAGTAAMKAPQNTGQDGPTALRPGDIVLGFEGFDGGAAESGTLTSLSGAGGFHVQSASISIPLDSESWSSSIGSNKSVDITFGVQLGGIEDTSRGIICSGAGNTRPVFGA